LKRHLPTQEFPLEIPAFYFAQAATIFLSAPEMIPHSRAELGVRRFQAGLEDDSRAERCHGGFRAENAVKSRAGGNISLFRADSVANSRAEWCHGGFCAEKAANFRAKCSKRSFRAGLKLFSRLYSFVSRQVLVSLQIQFLSYVKTDVFGSCSGQLYLCRQGFQI
jgi:hypothetical protein